MDYDIKKEGESCCFSYRSRNTNILFGMKDVSLSDSEMNIFISDSITHEHIHRLLDREFNFNVCSMFDLIEYHFRDNNILHKYLKLASDKHGHFSRCSYSQFKDIYGIKALRKDIGVTLMDIKQANRFCKHRRD